MRAGVVHHALIARPPKSLVVQGSLVRTFGGLAGFLVVTFLCAGFYILEDAFADPLAEGAAAIVSAAFIITLAAVLLFFLIKPVTRPRAASHKRSVNSPAAAAPHSLKPAAGGVHRTHLRDNLAYQRFYVDRSSIRP